MDNYVSVAEAAKQLRVSTHYVRKLMHDGKIKGIQVDGSYYIDKESIQKFSKNRKTTQHNVDGQNIEYKMIELMENIEGVFNGDIILYTTLFGRNNSMIVSDDGIYIDTLLNIMPAKFQGDNKKFKKILLFLSSPGGILEASVKIIDIIRQYAESFEVIVPYMAKSAASLICLSSDKIHMTTISELGPIDPIIQHPTMPGVMIPAKAIDDFMKYYADEINKGGAVQNSLLKMLETRIDPLLLGTRKSALMYSQKEIKEALSGKIDAEKLKSAITLFTTDDISHSHPITYNILQNLGLKNIEQINDGTVVGLVKQLFGICNDYMNKNNIVKILGNRENNYNFQDPQRNN